MQEGTNFPKAFVTLTDQQVLTRKGPYDMSDVLGAEVVEVQYPIRWKPFVEIYLLGFLLFGILWAVFSVIGRISIPGYMIAICWLMITVFSVGRTINASYSHELRLKTKSGDIEVCSSSDAKSLREACDAINRALKLSVISPVQLPQPLGELTRRI